MQATHKPRGHQAAQVENLKRQAAYLRGQTAMLTALSARQKEYGKKLARLGMPEAEYQAELRDALSMTPVQFSRNLDRLERAMGCPGAATQCSRQESQTACRLATKKNITYDQALVEVMAKS